jgi:hypothetical protein
MSEGSHIPSSALAEKMDVIANVVINSNFFIFMLFMIIPYRDAKLVKVFYFRYGIYTRAGHDVSDVKTAAFVMLSTFPE